MPWRAYAALTDADARAPAAYPKSGKPVKFSAPAPAGETEKAPAPFFSIVEPK